MSDKENVCSHIFYEFKMYLNTYEYCREHSKLVNEIIPKGIRNLFSNAIWESHRMHIRLLIDFFRFRNDNKGTRIANKKKKYDNDFFCDDFLDEFDFEDLTSVWKAASKGVAHFSEDRLNVINSNNEIDGVDIEEAYKVLSKAIEKFIYELSSGKLKDYIKDFNDVDIQKDYNDLKNYFRANKNSNRNCVQSNCAATYNDNFVDLVEYHGKIF